MWVYARRQSTVSTFVTISAALPKGGVCQLRFRVIASGKNSSQLLNSIVTNVALICSTTKMKQSTVAYICQGGEKRGIEAENNYPPIIKPVCGVKGLGRTTL